MARVLMFAAGIAVCAAAQAADTATLAEPAGTGIELKRAPGVDARLGYSAPRWSRDLDTADIFRRGDTRLSKLNAPLDSRPLNPAFRMTSPSSFTAKVEAGNRTTPYLGLGKGTVAGAGPSFYADAGLILTGPNSALSVDCTGLSLGQCLALQNHATTEPSAFRAYPALNLGVTFGF